MSDSVRKDKSLSWLSAQPRAMARLCCSQGSQICLSAMSGLILDSFDTHTHTHEQTLTHFHTLLPKYFMARILERITPRHVCRWKMLNAMDSGTINGMQNSPRWPDGLEAPHSSTTLRDSASVKSRPAGVGGTGCRVEDLGSDRVSMDNIGESQQSNI